MILELDAGNGCVDQLRCQTSDWSTYAPNQLIIEVTYFVDSAAYMLE